MALAYTKEFLISAFLHRYKNTGDCSNLRRIVEKQYDEVGKDKFRLYASLDAEAIRKYKAALKAMPT